MGKTEEIMELNRETAMRLWVRDFGKASKATDFAGREIAKGAYNDRNSNFGWNVDHILPQSKGGKTTDSNLICCHILTNDEKADKFPCFVANGKRFEIIKVQNHYEIREVNDDKSADGKTEQEVADSVNLLDSAAGTRYFEKLKDDENRERFVGSVLIRIRGYTDSAVVDFIEKLFDKENITFSRSDGNINIVARNYDMPTRGETAALLDKCILTNTYLGHYFRPKGNLGSYEIIYRIDQYENRWKMYRNIDRDGFGISSSRLSNSLFINNLVIINTEAKDKVQPDKHGGYIEYNYIYTNLSKNLDKEVNGN